MTQFPTSSAAKRRSFALRLGFIAGALAAMVVAGGALYYRGERNGLRVSIWRELDAIADLKVSQLADWRKERLSDGRFLMRTSGIARDVARYLENADSVPERAAVRDWLQTIKGGDRYESVLLVDRGLNIRLAIPETAAIPNQPLRERLMQVFATGDLIVTDLHRADASRQPHLDLLAPVFAPGGVPDAQPREPIAVIVFRILPETYLFPLIQNWPAPSPSAETMLVRREGDEVLYLNELPHAPRSALTLRRPVSELDLDAVGAGQARVREGIDYRGVAVLAAVRSVPGTPWLLIAKIDRAEAYAPIRRQAWTIGGMVAVLVLGVGGAAAYLWRVRNEQILRRTLAAEQESRLLAERLALLTRHANDIVILADAGEPLRVIDANDRALEAYGYTAEEFRRLRLPALRAAEPASGLGRDVGLLRSSGSIVIETVHRRKDGSCFPVEVSSRIVTLGGRTYILGVLRDITERKRSESALRDSEARFRSAVETAPDAIFVQIRGLFAYVNPTSLTLFGAPNKEALLGKPMLDRFAADQRAAVAARIRRLNEDRQSVVLTQETCVRLDGTPVHVEVSAVPFTFEGEQGGLVFARDITDRMTAEEALRESEERYRTLFENNNAPMLLIDPAGGVIVDANPAAARFYGWSREQLRVMNISHINILPEAEIQAEMERARASRRHQFTFRHRLADGSCRDVEVFTTGIAVGARSLLVSIIHDVTDRKAAEAALRESQAALAAQLDELRRWHAVTLGRETRVLELKAEVNRLLVAAGQSPRYSSVESGAREADAETETRAPLAP